MEYPLHFNRQTWKPVRDGELTLFLPASAAYGVSFDASFTFVPPWLEEEDFESEHRKLYLTLHGYFPDLTDWRELEGGELESREAIEVMGEQVAAGARGPEIEIWSAGKGAASIHTHARDGWETRLKVDEPVADDGYTFLCEVEAFFPSERAREVCAELWMQELMGQLDFDDEEKARLLEEGWRFRYRGRLSLEQVHCVVPLNTTDPIGSAQRMARRDLAMKQFGFCQVNGGNLDGSYKPEHGVCANGRLVLLSPPSAFFLSWQESQKEKKRNRDEGSPQE